MDKHQIARVFEEIATILELKGDNPFKVRAYRNAAKMVESSDLDALIANDSLTSLQGIGKDLAEKITSLYQTDKLELYDQLKKSIPKELFELLSIPSLGPKKIKTLYEQLNVTSLESLKAACLKGKVQELKGFSTKSEQAILQGIENLTAICKRMLWIEAEAFSTPILAELKKHKGVIMADIAGSFRRKLETVGDIDLLAASSEPEKVIGWFSTRPQVTEVLAKGPTKLSVRFGGVQTDLRVVPEECYPFAMHYFTGSKEHDIKMRKIAHDLGYRLSEWGLEKLDGSPVKHRIKSEEDIYRFFNMCYIPPELREDRGEIEAAAKNKLPNLVVEEDIQGVFHNHTTESDGHNTLEEMARMAEALGFSYLGIADHSPSSFQANGLSEERLIAQIEKIGKLNRSKKFKVHIFSGTECDILNDGSLDWRDDLLQELDYVVVSIHRSFQKDATKRLIRAIEHPLSTMVGHLTGRLLLKRKGYELNTEKVIDAAIANGKIIEINAQPERLDMDWRLWHAAKEKGLKCSINPDAHRAEGLKLFRLGVNVARKRWLEKSDIINTYSLKKVTEVLKKGPIRSNP